MLAEARKGNAISLARLLSWLEGVSVRAALELKELWRPQKPAFRIGITGPPGAGKSTLVARLITKFREKDLRVGVLAVDPSSPFSAGAILGDRIRLTEHFHDPGVFIRSLGTRGSLGGLSSSAFLMARAFDACSFDIVLIETVGVGQTELDVVLVADTVCVVLVPESGDSIQVMKAGLMEIGDIFVVNKADRPGAEALAREIEASFSGGEARPPVVRCVASEQGENSGVHALFEILLEHRNQRTSRWRRDPQARWREEARALLRAEFERGADRRIAKVRDWASFVRVFQGRG